MIVKILGLLARHFLLCLCFWSVEIRIRLLSFLSVHVVRWQVRLIRFSGLFGLIAFALITGCAHKQIPNSYAPSSAPILRAVTAAKASAAALKGHVATPEGLRTLAELNSSLDSSLTEVAAYSAKVDEVSVALTKAEEAANYWRQKQAKGLRELWMWRGAAALLLGCVAGWFALRSGLKLAL
jgi:hypothetical protein